MMLRLLYMQLLLLLNIGISLIEMFLLTYLVTENMVTMKEMSQDLLNQSFISLFLHTQIQEIYMQVN